MTVGVVAALVAEARALHPAARRTREVQAVDGTLLQISGVGAAAATHAAEGLIRAGAQALISWGVAGALDATLGTGAVCLPRTVLDARENARASAPTPAPDPERFNTSIAWHSAFRAALTAEPGSIEIEGIQLTEGMLLCGATALATAADKRAAHAATGAVAVDMESAAVARVAQRAALPFIAVRVIIDTVNDEVPPSVIEASRGGPLKIGRLCRGLLAAPDEVAPLFGLARRFRIARRRLRAVARLRPPAA